MKNKKPEIFFALCALALPVFTSAASLSFDPVAKQAHPGDVVVVPIRIMTSPGECVNAGEITLSYPADKVSVETLGHGGSIFPIWLNENIDNKAGLSSFTIGIPGGYCGAVAGDTGGVNVVAKVALQYRSDQPVVISFASSTNLALADGAGTPAALDTKPLTISLASGATVRNEWLGEIVGDHFPPEQFTADIMKDPTDEKSPFYLVWNTTDKQSGIDHYTVREEDPRTFGFLIGSRARANNIPVISPYVLQDQTLRSRIVLRAFDKAGNITESILPPTNERPIFEANELGTILFIGAGAIAFILVMLYSMRRMWWSQSEE